MPDAILALNAGSSSLKFGVFAIGAQASLTVVGKGQIAEIPDHPHLTATNASGSVVADKRWRGTPDLDHLLRDLLEWVDDHLGKDRLVAAGHRIVHGGRAFVDPVKLDDQVVAALEALTPLAPLHQPGSLAPVRTLQTLRPDLLQVGCFDTAFHHGLGPPVSRYAIPRVLEAKGIRRYGFHGLSYEFVASDLSRNDPDLARKRLVVAHLGNGASLCAMRESRSVDTTMGFTALDGLVMGTRCGAIDPGIVLYLQQELGLTAKQVETMLYHESGLLGVSEFSADVRVLLESSDPKAAEALDVFVFSVARGIAVMAHTLQGLDGLVFTGGIGEHASAVRARVCAQLRWLGVELDPQANDDGARHLNSPGGSVEVRIIETNEEMTIARHVSKVRSKLAS